MGLNFNNKIPAAERRGIIVLAFVIAVTSFVVATCESGYFNNPVTISETPADTIHSKKQHVQSKKKQTKRMKRQKKSKENNLRPRSPLDEPITTD